MIYRLVVHELLDRDVASSAEWLAERSSRASNSFIDAVNEEIALILDHPLAYPEVRRGVRRAIISRFHHLMFFRVRADVINLLGVVHGMREVNQWLDQRLRV